MRCPLWFWLCKPPVDEPVAGMNLEPRGGQTLPKQIPSNDRPQRRGFAARGVRTVIRLMVRAV